MDPAADANSMRELSRRRIAVLLQCCAPDLCRQGGWSIIPMKLRASCAKAHGHSSRAEGELAKVALITGITGQDGAYLAEFLLKKGYIVHGVKRRASSFNTDRIDHLYQDPHEQGVRLTLHYGDLTDSTNLIRIIQEVQPDEIYNLAAQSHVHDF